MREQRKANDKVRQTIPAELRYTLLDFNDEFPNDDACLAYIAEEKMPGGVTTCDKCKVERKHHRVRGRTAYACDYCGNHIYPLAGTIFEKTTTALKLWFYAIYLMGSTRCGISAKQIQRELGVTYKTAWRMFHQIRTLMSEDDTKLDGPIVEIDDGYYGGVRKYGTGRPMRGDRKKTPMIAIVQRHSKVVAKAVKDVSGRTALSLIKKHVVPGSVIHSDELYSYDGISHIRMEDGSNAGYKHLTIRHKDRVYVNGQVHTNSVEGFWSLIKRGIGGVYHSVGQKYLQSYLDEYTFRHNRRHVGNQQFKALLERVSG